MERLKKYNLSEEDLDFIGMLIDLYNNGTPFNLDCNGYTFEVEPGEGLDIYHKEKIAEFSDIIDMFENFKVNGKTLIEQIDDVGFEDE